MPETGDRSAGVASRLGDSPWFWVLVFALFALGALAAIVPKHLQRQTRLERMHFARQVSRPGAADSGAPQRELAAADLPAPQVLSLFALLLCIASLAAVRLYVGRRRSSAAEGVMLGPEKAV